MPGNPRRSWREIARFAEAFVAIGAASATIKLLPFRTVVRSMGRGAPAVRAAGDTAPVAYVRQAIDRAVRRIPWRTVCFDRGLALHWMLRRRGYASQLHYGLKQSEGRLSAHVWITLGGETVIGEESGEPHACVAVFPAE